MTSTKPPNSRRSGKSASAFRTISEVAEDLDVPPHVLRFWETKFTQIKPLKRGGRRRYYRPEDVILLRRIRQLLYGEGYTIKGVQRLLRDGLVNLDDGDAGAVVAADESRADTSPRQVSLLDAIEPAAASPDTLFREPTSDHVDQKTPQPEIPLGLNNLHQVLADLHDMRSRLRAVLDKNS